MIKYCLCGKYKVLRPDHDPERPFFTLWTKASSNQRLEGGNRYRKSNKKQGIAALQTEVSQVEYDFHINDNAGVNK